MYRATLPYFYLNFASLHFNYLEIVGSNPVTGVLVSEKINCQFVIRVCLLSEFVIVIVRTLAFDKNLNYCKFVHLTTILWSVLSTSVNSTSQPLIATRDQQGGHRVVNLPHQWHSHWLKNQSDTSAHLPRTPSCCRDAPGDEANLVRYGNVQFDSNLCVVNRM